MTIYCLYALIPHPEQDSFFLLRGALPMIDIEADGPWALNAGEPRVRKMLRVVIGALGDALRRIYYNVDETDNIGHIVYEFAPVLPTAAGQWVSPSDIVAACANAEYVSAIRTYFEERTTGKTPAKRAPWTTTAWRQRAEAWIRSQVPYPIVSLETERSWALSHIIKIHTKKGDFYFKAWADLSIFGDEGAVMTMLSDHYETVPRPLCHDSRENWMISADLGPLIGEEDDDEKNVAQVMARQAQLQIASAEKIPQLIQAGCINRDLAWLKPRIKPLLTDSPTLAYLTSDQRTQLQANIPHYLDLCDQLAQSGIPTTLLHGDLHLGNVARTDNKLRFFDWTDAAVGFPFFDAISVLAKDREKEQQVCDTYLAHWTAYAPLPQLQTIWQQVARPLLGLYHALSYDVIMRETAAVECPGLQSNGASFLRLAL